MAMDELIYQLTLGAGLNTEAAICAYLEISRSTWYRRLAAGKLRRVEREALRHRAGYLLHDGWREYRLVGDRIYSPVAGFATAAEIENMDFIRQFAGIARMEQKTDDREKRPARYFRKP